MNSRNWLKPVPGVEIRLAQPPISISTTGKRMVAMVMPKPGRRSRGSRSRNWRSSGFSAGSWMRGTMNLAYSGPAMIAVGIPIAMA
ncbi:hypothetical protein D3C85_1727270 [compost metagenome]